MTLSIAIAGAAGRMGRALIRAASADARFTVAGGSERRDSANLDADLGMLAGLPASGIVTHDSASAAASKADVWLDFTTPHATLAALESLTATQVRAAIVGTTGLNPEQEAAIAAHAKRIAIVRSGNFSLGVNLLAALVEQAASKLGPEWDIEIVEAHHRRKIDAPSGTALLLGEAAARGRAAKLEALRTPPRDGLTGPRDEGSIGFAVVRGGGIVGEHDVLFAAEREVLKLSHQALDRAVFADGALAAALWAANKPPGLYSMRDVLGL
ncbi:MAG: 4-hydroxy-tetrahydrodipicolinate reductase [Hyphomonadaceae bacterium]|nr:4-hydroxy-tetrahydrodipicolinate reductase [Hyphomonadaceae bacterium]